MNRKDVTQVELEGLVRENAENEHFRLELYEIATDWIYLAFNDIEEIVRGFVDMEDANAFVDFCVGEFVNITVFWEE